METTEIISKILEFSGENARSFALKTKIPYQKMVNLKNEIVKKVPGDVAILIHKKYPQINLEWILTGEGEMLVNNNSNSNNNSSTFTINNDRTNICGNHDNNIGFGGADSVSYQREIESLKAQIERLHQDKDNLQRIIDKLLEK